MSEAPHLQRQLDVKSLWEHVTDQVKQRITLPSLWRAMEAAHPITVEEEQVVLGFESKDAHQGGLITDNRHLNVIEQVLESATGRRLKVRIIAGVTREDWEAARSHQRAAAALQAESLEKRRRETEAGQTWEVVSEQLIRRFSATPSRSLCSVRGRYLEEAVQILVEAYRRLMPSPPGELDERSYSRALERVADRVAVPPALIAQMIYLRLRQQ